jgi:hypothetical protein
MALLVSGGLLAGLAMLGLLFAAGMVVIMVCLGQFIPGWVSMLAAVAFATLLGGCAVGLLGRWLWAGERTLSPSLVGANLAAIAFVCFTAWKFAPEYPVLREWPKEADMAGVFGFDAKTAESLRQGGYADASGDLALEPGYTFAAHHVPHRWLGLALDNSPGPVELGGYDTFSGRWRVERGENGGYGIRLDFEKVSADSATPHGPDGALEQPQAIAMALCTRRKGPPGYALRVTLPKSDAADLILVQRPLPGTGETR